MEKSDEQQNQQMWEDASEGEEMKEETPPFVAEKTLKRPYFMKMYFNCALLNTLLRMSILLTHSKALVMVQAWQLDPFNSLVPLWDVTFICFLGNQQAREVRRKLMHKKKISCWPGELNGSTVQAQLMAKHGTKEWD